MSEHDFCRKLMVEIMVDVRKHTTAVERSKAWAWDDGRNYEFHGPDGFFWHGQACCRWAARAQGWSAYLEKLGVEGYVT